MVGQVCILLLSAAFGAFAQADVSAQNVIRVQTPAGIKTVTIPRANEKDILGSISPRPSERPPYEDLKLQPKLLTEVELNNLLKVESEKLIVRFIQLTGQMLNIKNIKLDTSAKTPVSYTVERYDSYGWSTEGFGQDCWDCGSQMGIREVVSQHFGLQQGSLYDKVSSNPRFAVNSLFRSSANLVQIIFQTVEQGAIRFPLVITINDIYHPFVADLPSQDSNFGNKIYGTSQSVQVYAGLNTTYKDESNRKKIELLFPIVELVTMRQTDRLAIVSASVTNDLPSIFSEVSNNAVTGSGQYTDSDNAPNRFVIRALSDLAGFIALTNTHLDMPGTKLWYQVWK